MPGLAKWASPKKYDHHGAVEPVQPRNRSMLLHPLDVYEHVFWRSMHIVLWLMAYICPLLAVVSFVSVFVDLPFSLYMNGDRVESSDEKIGCAVSAAIASLVGHALLRRLRNPEGGN